MTQTFRVADLFCGAGGSSTGAQRAIRALGAEMELVAVNHWPTAIATHQRNHPSARHYVEDVTAAKPREIVPDGYLDLLMASPECTHFSQARGGRPVNDQSRMNAWTINRWLTDLNVRCLLVENVPEFQTWGPLLENNRPDPARKGEYFEAWWRSLTQLGYEVQWRVLNAADFGDATTRKRFFLIARRDGKPIRWPEATHGPEGSAELFAGRKRWRAAREVIDWSNPGRSLLDDPKYHRQPLSLKTRLRIARGLLKFGGPLAPHYVALLDLGTSVSGDGADAAPGRGITAHPPECPPLGQSEGGPAFLFANRNNATPKGMDDPVPTLTTATGGGVCAVEPTAFVLPQRDGNPERSVGEPLPTIVTVSRIGVVEGTCEPFLLGQQQGAAARSTEEPLPTVATAGAISLTAPCITPYYGTAGGVSVEEPLPTVTTKDRFGLVEPMAVPYGPRSEARSVEEPLPTILTKDRLGLATPMIVRYNGENPGEPPLTPLSVEQPLGPITAGGTRFALVAPEAQPFMVAHFGEREGQAPRVHSVEDPLPAVTGRGGGELVAPIVVEPMLEAAGDGEIDPRRLVLVDGVPHLLDIRFRMLRNPELARAMGFGDEEAAYEFTGTQTDITKQIGNAVPVGTAAALVGTILG